MGLFQMNTITIAMTEMSHYKAERREAGMKVPHNEGMHPAGQKAADG